MISIRPNLKPLPPPAHRLIRQVLWLAQTQHRPPPRVPPNSTTVKLASSSSLPGRRAGWGGMGVDKFTPILQSLTFSDGYIVDRSLDRTLMYFLCILMVAFSWGCPVQTFHRISAEVRRLHACVLLSNLIAATAYRPVHLLLVYVQHNNMD